MLGAVQGIKCCLFLPLLFTILLSQLPTIWAKHNIEMMKCAVCRALIGEVNYKISQTDPKKKVQIGSFRVDPDGNQKTHEVPYGRSEIYLVDVMETLCGSMNHYAETTNELGKKSIVRTTTYDGEAVSLDNFKIDSDIVQNLKTMCDDLLEEYEEKMVSILRRLDIKDHETRICRDVIRACTSDDMTVPMPKAPLKADVEKAAEEREKLRNAEKLTESESDDSQGKSSEDDKEEL